MPVGRRAPLGRLGRDAHEHDERQVVDPGDLARCEDVVGAWRRRPRVELDEAAEQAARGARRRPAAPGRSRAPRRPRPSRPSGRPRARAPRSPTRSRRGRSPWESRWWSRRRPRRRAPWRPARGRGARGRARPLAGRAPGRSSTTRSAAASLVQRTRVRVASPASVTERLGTAGKLPAPSRLPQYLLRATFGCAMATASRAVTGRPRARPPSRASPGPRRPRSPRTRRPSTRR